MALPINKANPDVQWKIYYHDPNAPDYFTTFSNLDGSAEDAPEYGVICVVQPTEGGRFRERVCNADYYAVDEEGKWVPFNEDGLDDRNKNNIPYSALKKGRWINTERYQEILTRAFSDVDFGGDGTFTAVER